MPRNTPPLAGVPGPRASVGHVSAVHLAKRGSSAGLPVKTQAGDQRNGLPYSHPPHGAPARRCERGAQRWRVAAWVCAPNAGWRKSSGRGRAIAGAVGGIGVNRHGVPRPLVGKRTGRTLSVSRTVGGRSREGGTVLACATVFGRGGQRIQRTPLTSPKHSPFVTLGTPSQKRRDHVELLIQPENRTSLAGRETGTRRPESVSAPHRVACDGLHGLEVVVSDVGDCLGNVAFVRGGR